jgi:hypothetical protein
MSKCDIIADVLNIKDNGMETVPSLDVKFPDVIKDSFKKNKKELIEIYQHSKELFINLIEDAKHISKPRDIEVLTEFMGQIQNLLKNIREVDDKMFEQDNKEANNNDNEDKEKNSKTINQIILAGDTRDLMNLVKTMRDKKEEKVVSEQ